MADIRTPRIVQAWNRPGGIACVRAWIDEQLLAGSLEVVTEQDGKYNDAEGADAANNTHYWGIVQTKLMKLPNCTQAVIGEWDGTTPPEDYRSHGGPPVYTLVDATLDAGAAVVDRVEAAVKSSVDTARLVLALALAGAMVWFTRGKR